MTDRPMKIDVRRAKRIAERLRESGDTSAAELVCTMLAIVEAVQERCSHPVAWAPMLMSEYPNGAFYDVGTRRVAAYLHRSEAEKELDTECEVIASLITVDDIILSDPEELGRE